MPDKPTNCLCYCPHGDVAVRELAAEGERLKRALDGADIENKSLRALVADIATHLKEDARHLDRCGCRDEGDNEGLCPGVTERLALLTRAREALGGGL